MAAILAVFQPWRLILPGESEPTDVFGWVVIIGVGLLLTTVGISGLMKKLIPGFQLLPRGVKARGRQVLLGIRSVFAAIALGVAANLLTP